MSKVLSKEVRKAIDAAVKDNTNIVFISGRNSGRRLIQDYIFMRQWPKGRVAVVGIDGIRILDEAEAEEIKENQKE